MTYHHHQLAFLTAPPLDEQEYVSYMGAPLSKCSHEITLDCVFYRKVKTLGLNDSDILCLVTRSFWKYN